MQCSARNKAYITHYIIIRNTTRPGLSPNQISSVHSDNYNSSLIIYSYLNRDTLFFAVHVRGGVTVSNKEGMSGKINIQYPKRLLWIHDSREGFKAELCADTILPPYCAEYLSDSFHCRGNCNKYIENKLTLYLLLNIIIIERTPFWGAMFWPLYSGTLVKIIWEIKKITWESQGYGMTFITRLLH